jgi:glucose dehydrogenase
MDLDMVAPPVVYRGEGTQDLLVFGGKDGYVTGVDRDTRKSVFRTPVTTVITPPKDPPLAGAKMCPGYAGGVEWNGPALDRQNNQLITGAVDVCFNVKLGKAKYKAGALDFGGSIEPVGEDTGWITAIDALTGAVRWKYHAEKPVVAGITPTAGGVTFAGDLAGNLLIFDSKSGALLRKPAWSRVMAQVLAARDRKAAAPTFAPDGLYFAGPVYDPKWGLPPEPPSYDWLPGHTP